EHLAVGHVALEVERAGAQVTALAGERRAQVEEEARGDHAGARELIADLPRGRMRRDGDPPAPLRGAVERLVDLHQEPDGTAGERERQYRGEPADPLPYTRRACRPP